MEINVIQLIHSRSFLGFHCDHSSNRLGFFVLPHFESKTHLIRFSRFKLVNTLPYSLYSTVMAPRSVLITGANRGIGLQFVRVYASMAGCDHVLATCRDQAAAKDLVAFAQASEGKVVILELDVTQIESYPAFVKRVNEVVGDAGLNLLINNAGYLPRNMLWDQVTPEDMRRAFEVNCVAPVFLTKALLPLVQRAADAGKEASVDVSRAGIVHISTAVASIAENSSGAKTGGFGYRCSKSALNQAMKCMAIDLEDSGILVMCIHPGWVQTDMGGSNALLTAETSAKTMVETLATLGPADHGAFRRYDNTTIPW